MTAISSRSRTAIPPEKRFHTAVVPNRPEPEIPGGDPTRRPTGKGSVRDLATWQNVLVTRSDIQVRSDRKTSGPHGNPVSPNRNRFHCPRLNTRQPAPSVEICPPRGELSSSSPPTEHFLCLAQSSAQGIDLIARVVKRQTRACGGRNAQKIVQWHRAMMASPDRDPPTVEHRRHIGRLQPLLHETHDGPPLLRAGAQNP